jgi:hypothetical protein
MGYFLAKAMACFLTWFVLAFLLVARYFMQIWS